MHFLITAGGTREYIDPVRFISNASTGKTGYALARAAIAAGHKVTLITAPVSIRPPGRAKLVNVKTSAEMFEAVKKYFDRSHCLIMAAAVSDYTPVSPSKTKIKKTDADLTIRLKPTADILKWAAKNKKNQLVVGFALEDKAVKTRAQKKLTKKNLDMIIANTTAAIGAETSTVHIKTPTSKWIQLGPEAKSTIAKKIIRLIQNM
jgi:phosphopantothenoylcysteine decarboxylase/phosphopantothenate--cysteine ligase